MKKIIFSFFLLSFLDANSQYKLGISSSNYAGTNGMYLNPSSIADSRYKVYINIASFDHSINNNYARWTSNMPVWAIYSPYLPIPDAWKLNITNNRIDLSGEKPKLKIITNQSDDNRDLDIANFKNVGNVSAGDPNLRLSGNTNFDIPILATQFDFPKLNATIGFGMRNRVLFDIRNLSEVSARFLGGSTNSSFNNIFVNAINPVSQNMDMKLSVLKETSFSFAKVIFNDEVNQIKLGGSFKLNGGVFHMGMKYDNAYFQLTNASKGTAGKEDINQINIDKVDFASMHITPVANLKTFASNLTNPIKLINPFSIFDKNQFSGLGFGGDIGVTYEFLDPDLDFSSRKFKNIEKTKNKYILKIGASINDIGFTKFKSTSIGDVKYFEKENVDFKGNYSQLPINNLQKFGISSTESSFSENWFAEVLGVLQANPVSSGYRVGLPTNLVLNIDYKLMQNVYIGGILIQNISNLISKYSQPAPSIVAVLPRFESKYFDFSLPISLTNQYQILQLGLGFRTGPLFFGTDHITSFLNIGKPRGSDFYFGASIPIYHKPIKKVVDEDYGSISLAEQVRIYLRKKHLRKLHRKEMKRG